MKECVKKAVKKYRKNTIIKLQIDLNKNTDADIIEHLSQQQNKSKYIKNLIKTDIHIDKLYTM